jgi:hypothetical protein
MKKLENALKGHKSRNKGLTFEKQMGEYLSKKGYTISYEKPIGQYMFDVFGTDSDSLTRERYYYIIECKNKERVTLAEIVRFRKKLNMFYKRCNNDPLYGKPDIKAMLAYTGNIPVDAADMVKGTYPKIQFKKF